MSPISAISAISTNGDTKSSVPYIRRIPELTGDTRYQPHTRNRPGLSAIYRCSRRRKLITKKGPPVCGPSATRSRVALLLARLLEALVGPSKGVPRWLEAMTTAAYHSELAAESHGARTSELLITLGVRGGYVCHLDQQLFGQGVLAGTLAGAVAVEFAFNLYALSEFIACGRPFRVSAGTLLSLDQFFPVLHQPDEPFICREAQ